MMIKPPFSRHGIGHCARTVLLACITLLFCTVGEGALAGVIYVDINNQTPGFPDGSLERPYRSIQQAINAADTGDIVQVAPGVYFESISMRDGVSVIGAGAQNTILNGSQSDSSVVTFTETRFSPRLSGFTITQGSGNNAGLFMGIVLKVGGGISVINSAPVITDNIITDNIITGGIARGGGIYVNTSLYTPAIFQNEISNNVAQPSDETLDGEGGGIYVRARFATVNAADNRIFNNVASRGGGVFANNIGESSINFQRNAIESNTAAIGAAVFARQSSGAVTTLVNNLIGNNGSMDGVSDCDDSDPTSGPDLPELCNDGRDNDCNPETPDLFDSDGDGFRCDLECDDTNAAVNPSRVELCTDGIDNDCDGDVDAMDADCACPDLDSDGFACGDCNDDEPSINPNAPEICNDGIDNDCNPATTDAFDGDGDGFSCLLDCDDQDPEVNPAALEVGCDGLDNDCNPETPDVVDEDGDLFTCSTDCDDSSPAINPRSVEFCFDDVDNNCDGFVDDQDPECICDQPIDADMDGYRCLDCNDSDPAINPAASEVCDDGKDNDCNFGTPDIFDGDGDGFLCTEDCQDQNPNVNTAAFERCNDGLDNDCDGLTDLEDDDCACADDDEDGFACSDCDDTRSEVNPGSPEVCNDGLDNDCDPATPDLLDGDGDGFTCVEDCRDDDPSVFPGAPEHCRDLIDNDCDGLIDITDPDRPETILIQAGSPIRYLANYDDPGIGLSWTAEFFDDTPWSNGVYGVGYEVTAGGAGNILSTLVPQGAGSIYTRATFEIVELEGVNSLWLAADYDDGYVAWINGVEVYRSPEMPLGDPVWDVDPELHESSNADTPQYGRTTDISAVALPHLREGANQLAIGIYNDFPDIGGISSDLVLVPQLFMFYGTDDPDCECTNADLDAFGCGDCDDTDPDINPGAAEITCDGVDNDCNPATPDLVDEDADGFLCNVDCEDTVPEINPDAVEITCDFIDNDCNALTLDLVDADNDGFICDCVDNDPNTSPAETEIFCDGIDNDCNTLTPDVRDIDGDGFACNLDCDESTSLINPNAPERCDDRIDNDCDGLTDEEDVDECGCVDADGDGYACGNDCNESDALISSGMQEVCNDTIDNDCDPTTPDVFDGDGDGYDCLMDCNDASPFASPGLSELCADGIDNDCNPATPDIFDADGDFSNCVADCDDNNAAINPGADEVCNDALDNDCNPATPDLFDEDGDSFDCSVDCNDDEESINPAAAEICDDGLDNDCDPTTADLFDGDQDGSSCAVDCSESNPSVGPNVAERCDDGIDNDCDELIDEMDPDCGCGDVDGDGYSCSDCDDEVAETNPGAIEICDDGIDNDCNLGTSDIDDLDDDGFTCKSDCNDADPSVFPGAPEVCADGIDNDCSPLTDDLFDIDGDGFTCDVDCNDLSDAMNPSLSEVSCDGIDNDCNPSTPDAGDLDGDDIACVDLDVRGGAISAEMFGSGSMVIVNNTIVDNYIPNGIGGAIWIDDMMGDASTLIANNVVSGNDALVGGGIDLTRFSGNVATNAFWNNGNENIYDGGGSAAVVTDNVVVDPGFISAPSRNYRLRVTSPLIDSADPAFAPSNDLERLPRPYDGDGDGIAMSDLGAYEFPSGEVVGLRFLDKQTISWDIQGFEDRYNLYRGALNLLRNQGAYTQNPELPIPAQFCDLAPQQLPFPDSMLPESGAIFYLVTLSGASFEGTLGHASSGSDRPNTNPCP